MVRQHSIELYERENNTFRGYSFLHNDGHLFSEGHYHPFNHYQSDNQLFYLGDSKDHSLIGIGSPELDFSVEHTGGNEAELRMMFAVE